MANQQILVLFLKALVAAKKSVGLYPTGSQTAAEWVGRLHRSLQGFLQEGLTFPIRVGRDRFFWEHNELLTLDPVLEAFRFDLETRGVSEFAIDQKVEEWELERFLGLLNLPASSLATLASAAEYLREKGVLHIVVKGPRLQRGGEAGQAWLADAQLEDELDHFVDRILVLLGERLGNLTYDRQRLVRWFGELLNGDGSAPLVAALTMLSGTVGGATDRQLRVRTMMEALLQLPRPRLQALLTEWLVPSAGTDLVAFNLITQVTEDELGEVARLVPSEQLVALSSELLEFPWEVGERQRLIESITATLQRRGQSASALEVAGVLAQDDPRVVDLRNEITTACHPEALLERSVQILLAVVLQVESEEYPGFALDALEEMSGEAIARGRLDLALEIIRNLVESSRLNRDWMREHPRRIQLFVRRAASRTHVSLVAGLLRSSTGAHQIPLAAEYFRIVGREGVEEFVALLADEKQRAVRARMCQVLVRLGATVVPSLLPRLEDERWFVVRNVINVLGKIADSSTFLSAVAQTEHTHPRVRLEAVRALGAIGGQAAVGPLARCLADPDLEVRSATLRILGNLHHDDVVPVLRAVVARPSTEVGGDMEFKEQAVRAIAATGTELARRTLAELATRRLWPWKRTERRIRAMAAAALTSTSETRAAEEFTDA